MILGFTAICDQTLAKPISRAPPMCGLAKNFNCHGVAGTSVKLQGWHQLLVSDRWQHCAKARA